MTIAEQWFNDPYVVGDVQVRGAYSLTADGACPVVIEGSILAFMKPRPDAERKLVVAREKIASDLAHLIGVPVAPVGVLLPSSEKGWHYPFALSLVCLSTGRLWQEGGVAHLADVARTLEALRVFWTWIGCQDHNDHGGNLLYDVRSDGCSLAAIDHSYSLCHGNKDDSLAVARSNGYGTAGMPIVADVRAETIDAIRAADMRQIVDFVRRLGELLTADEQERIVRIISERRDGLMWLLGI